MPRAACLIKADARGFAPITMELLLQAIGADHLPARQGAFLRDPSRQAARNGTAMRYDNALARLRGLEGSSNARSLSINELTEKVFTTEVSDVSPMTILAGSHGAVRVPTLAARS